jgi:hypothetical protein
MRDYGIDGVWLQRFAVCLPGGPVSKRYKSLLDKMYWVRDAADKTGWAWAISYDIAGMPTNKMYDAVTADWKRLVDEKITENPRYLHEGGQPVVQIWGYYHNNNNFMTAEVGNQLIDFFQQPGPYQSLLVGGGVWNWRKNPDPERQKMFRRFKVWVPWNVGTDARDKATGIARANTSTWADDQRVCRENGTFWIPVVYPRYGTVLSRRKGLWKDVITRRHGNFLWEQFHRLFELDVDTVYVAVFHEVDEGTAIFKITRPSPGPNRSGRFGGDAQ